MRGIQNFQAADYGLQPIRMEMWGHFLFLNFNSNGKLAVTALSMCRSPAGAHCYPRRWWDHSFHDLHAGCGSLEAQLGPEGLRAMEAAGMTDVQLLHVASREYKLNCNWKVFCDNYLVRTESSMWYHLNTFSIFQQAFDIACQLLL